MDQITFTPKAEPREGAFPGAQVCPLPGARGIGTTAKGAMGSAVATIIL